MSVKTQVDSFEIMVKKQLLDQIWLNTLRLNSCSLLKKQRQFLFISETLGKLNAKQVKCNTG